MSLIIVIRNRAWMGVECRSNSLARRWLIQTRATVRSTPGRIACTSKPASVL